MNMNRENHEIYEKLGRDERPANPSEAFPNQRAASNFILTPNS